MINIIRLKNDQGAEEAWEVIEQLDEEAGIVIIRKLFDRTCQSDKLHIL